MQVRTILASGTAFPPMDRGLDPRSSILNRPTGASFPRNTPHQDLVDGLVSNFIDGATQIPSLAAMTVGSVAFRMGRLGLVGLGNSPFVKAASLGMGLAAEVSAFELAHRGLTSLSVVARSPRPQFVSNRTGGETPPLHPENPNLW